MKCPINFMNIGNMTSIKNNDCCVVVPTYKTIDMLSDFEVKSLSNTKDKLSKYDIVIVCPNKLDVTGYEQYSTNIIKFDNKFFTSLKSYNDLMLSPSFYEEFHDYRYILIVQLDAYVFDDKLSEFLDMDYDYIGSLHYTPQTGHKLINGNGGFSLRKVDAFIEASKNIKKDLHNRWDWEDILYSYYYRDHLNLAPYDVCLEFGWQQEPEKCFEEADHQLPFGCHKPYEYGRNFEKYQFLYNE